MNDMTNSVYVQGELLQNPQYNHSVKDEKFYTFDLKVDRLSDECDVLPVIISSKLLSMKNIYQGDKIAIRGQFRSHNMLEDGRSKLVLSVFCRDLEDWDENLNSNMVELTGYICKPPIYRTTPLNREICDLLLAVNRSNGKSDYIPCLAWGRNARFAGSLGIGTRLNVAGRIQSRKYNKKMDTGVEVTKIAYEVSIANLATTIDEDA